MLFPELNGADRKGKDFTAPQAATNQNCKDGMVPLAPQTVALRLQQQRPALLSSEPVSQAHADPGHAFDAPDARGKFRTE